MNLQRRLIRISLVFWDPPNFDHITNIIDNLPKNDAIVTARFSHVH